MYLVLSVYFDEHETCDTLAEAKKIAKAMMVNQHSDDGLSTGCGVEIYQRQFVVTGEIEVNINITKDGEK